MLHGFDHLSCKYVGFATDLSSMHTFAAGCVRKCIIICDRMYTDAQKTLSPYALSWQPSYALYGIGESCITPRLPTRETQNPMHYWRV